MSQGSFWWFIPLHPFYKSKFSSQFPWFFEGSAQSCAWQCHNLIPSEEVSLMIQDLPSLSRQQLGQFSWWPQHLLDQLWPYILLRYTPLSPLWEFGLLQDRLGHWCLHQVGLGVQAFFVGIDDYRVWVELKSSPCFNWYSIHVVVCEIEGSVLSLPVHSGLAIDPLQLEFWPIIMCMVISWVTHLEEKGFDVVLVEYMNGSVGNMVKIIPSKEELKSRVDIEGGIIESSL